MLHNLTKTIKDLMFKDNDSTEPTTISYPGMFDNLPPEIVLYLFTFLDCKDLLKLRLVHSAFKFSADEQLSKNSKHIETMKFFKERKYIFADGIMRMNPNYKSNQDFETCGCRKKW